jgi:hypothetical protein
VNGVSYLVADFRIRCGDTLWQRYLPVAVAGVLAYPIGRCWLGLVGLCCAVLCVVLCVVVWFVVWIGLDLNATTYFCAW